MPATILKRTRDHCDIARLLRERSLVRVARVAPSRNIAPPSRRAQARKVERLGSVCYSIWVRGVAQPGSAPALGAGGRPFKSARPDSRQ